MTIARHIGRRTEPAVVALLLSSTALLAAAMLSPRYALLAVGLPAGAASALYAVFRPSVMLAAIIVVEETNLAELLTPGSSLLPRALLGLGVISVVVALRNPLLRARVNRVTALAVVLVSCYLVSQILAAIGSQAVDSSVAQVRNSASDCAFLVMMLVLGQISGRPWMVAATIVVPFAALCALSLVSQVGFGGTEQFGGFATVTQPAAGLIETPRFGGPLPDSNFWGRHLVMAIPLCGALLARAIRVCRWKSAGGWAAAMFALLSGVYLTQSRGTIIATGVVFLVWVSASGPIARRRGLASLPVVGLLLFAPGIGNRLVAMLGDVSNSGPNHVVDPSILGRMAAQQIAWAMFQDRPFFGFGPATFKPVGIPHYAGIVRTAILDFAKGPDAPHNLYAQIAGETGVVGLVGWALLVGGFAAAMGVRISRTTGSSAVSERSLSAAVLSAVVGWSVASAFLHLAYFRTFALALALAGTLASEPLHASGAVSRLGRPAREVLCGGMIGLAVLVGMLVVPGRETHTASQRLVIMPTDQMVENYSYAFNIRTAEVLLPTCAAIAAAGDPATTAVADTVRGFITIKTSADSSNDAHADLESALARARNQMEAYGIGASYSLIEIGGTEDAIDSRHSPWWSAGALVTALAIAKVATQTLRKRLRRSRGRSAPRRMVSVVAGPARTDGQ